MMKIYPKRLSKRLMNCLSKKIWICLSFSVSYFIVFLFTFSLAKNSNAQDDKIDIYEILNQDFDEYISIINYEYLERHSRENAIYLISQSKFLSENFNNYLWKILENYEFKGTEEDLKFFVAVSTSSSIGFINDYCIYVLPKAMVNGDVEDCLKYLAEGFIRQYDKAIPAEYFTPSILDVLFNLTESDFLVRLEKFGELSGDRVLRFSEIEGSHVLEEEIVSVANEFLCFPLTEHISRLKVLREACFLDEITSTLVDEARPYKLVSTILDICDETQSLHTCYQDLTVFHREAGTCREPAHLAPVDGWYASRFFRTCLAGFISD